MNTAHTITLKLFTPRNDTFQTEIMRAPNGTRIEVGPSLDREIDEFCARYAQAYPGNEFAVRKISPRWYNIVWVAESAVKEWG